MVGKNKAWLKFEFKPGLKGLDLLGMMYYMITWYITLFSDYKINKKVVPEFSSTEGIEKQIDAVICNS